MEIGIFARTFARQTLDETLDAIRDHGIRSVHFNLACAGLPSIPEKICDEDVRRVRDGFRDNGLRMVALSGTFNAVHPDARFRKEMTHRCCGLIERSREMGTDLVTLCTGSRDPDDKWRWHPDNAGDESWNDLIATLRELLSAAKANRVTLGIEPEPANVVDSARKSRRLLDELGSDSLGIVMDGANLFRPESVSQMQEVLEEAFELIGANIVSVHAKDITCDETKKRQAAGTGLLAYDTCFRLIKQSGYHGAVVLPGMLPG